MVSAHLRKRQRLPFRREKVFSLSQTNSLLKHANTVRREKNERNLKKKKSQKIKNEFIFLQNYEEKLSESTTTLDQLVTQESEQ